MILKSKSKEISKPSRPPVASDEVFAEIERGDRDFQSRFVFLSESDEFRDYWQVEGVWPEYFFELEPIIGPYQLVHPEGLDDFVIAATEMGYRPYFLSDPSHILDRYEHLNDPPPIEVNSSAPNTIKGFFPWQVEGFNKLILNEDIHSGMFVWTVGSGKTVMIAAAIRYHQQIGHPFDIAMVVVKAHNKIETARKLLQFAGIKAIILDGSTVEKRADAYAEIYSRLLDGEQVVAVTNYEKFREDVEALKMLTKDRDVLFFWDEAPRKLSNRTTILYRRVKQVIYGRSYATPRVKWMRHWIFSATPIENEPGDIFSYVNLTWPGLLGTREEFEQQYVASWNFFSKERKPKTWRTDNLDRLGAQIGFMTHRVARDDPRIVKQFPERIPTPQIIDWNPKHLKLYNDVVKKAVTLFDENEQVNILSMIQVLQMLCDAPSMIQLSATNRAEFNKMIASGEDVDPKGSEIALRLVESFDPKVFTDVAHTKLDTWREIILERHPDEKIITHSTWAGYIFPIWEYWLNKWGVSYVIYDGPRKQEALDRFRNDPSIRVFLSGDSGSDSIDIIESRIGVNYNFPWKWTTLEQRVGRRDRADSQFSSIVTYDLQMANSMDERKKEICERKKGYHTAIFDRNESPVESAKLNRNEYYYVMTGQWLDSN